VRAIGWVPLVVLGAGVALVIDSVVSGRAAVSLLVIVPVVSGASGEFLLGVLLIVVGLILVPLGWSGTSDPAAPGAGSEGGASSSGGIILIGPIPILFGSWRSVSRRTRVWLALVGACLVILLGALAFLALR
jgi:uncharacterized protein (TIGR00304 family)